MQLFIRILFSLMGAVAFYLLTLAIVAYSLVGFGWPIAITGGIALLALVVAACGYDAASVREPEPSVTRLHIQALVRR